MTGNRSNLQQIASVVARFWQHTIFVTPQKWYGQETKDRDGKTEGEIFAPEKSNGTEKTPEKSCGTERARGKIEKGRKAPGPEKLDGTEKARPEKSDREKAPTVRRRRPEMIPAELARRRRRSRRPPALIPDAIQINRDRRRSCRRSAGSNASRAGDRPQHHRRRLARSPAARARRRQDARPAPAPPRIAPAASSAQDAEKRPETVPASACYYYIMYIACYIQNTQKRAIYFVQYSILKYSVLYANI